MTDTYEINLREQLIRIDQMRTDTARQMEETRKLIAEHDQMQLETKLEPWKLVVSAFAAGGGFVVAILALLSFLLHLMGKL